MSVPPPGPQKKETNPNIIIALIGAGGAVLAAAIPIVGSLMNKTPTTSPATPAAVTKPAATPTLTPQGDTDNQIPADALADKTSYTVTLNPYKRDPGGPDTYTAVADASFHSPKDRNKWVRLTITQHDHNKTVTLSASDFDRQNATRDISADKTREDQQERVETRNFKIVATLIEVKTGPDKDPMPLSGNVFEKLMLRISCEDKT